MATAKARAQKTNETRMVAVLALLAVAIGLYVTWSRGPAIERGDTLERRLDWARRTGVDWTQDLTEEERARWRDRIPWVQDKVFPLAQGTYAWGGGFGDPREDGAREHEGIDLMCAVGTPIHSVGAGTVERVGWLPLGGWRVGVRGDDGLYYYYAHLSIYAPALREGSRMRRGQVIGYSGDSGYGPEGTTGMMQPHLHFGMYATGANGEETAIDPQPYLRYWEYAAPTDL